MWLLTEKCRSYLCTVLSQVYPRLSMLLLTSRHSWIDSLSLGGWQHLNHGLATATHSLWWHLNPILSYIDHPKSYQQRPLYFLMTHCTLWNLGNPSHRPFLVSSLSPTIMLALRFCKRLKGQCVVGFITKQILSKNHYIVWYCSDCFLSLCQQQVKLVPNSPLLSPLFLGCWRKEVPEWSLILQFWIQQVSQFWQRGMFSCPVKQQEVQNPAYHGLKSPQVRQWR